MNYLFYLLFLPCLLFANEEQLPLKTKKVTVFLAGAQVSATAKANLKEGNNRLLFSDLSPNIQPNSIQVKGLNKVSVNAIQFDVTYLKQQDISEELQELKEKLQTLKDQLAAKQSKIDALKTEESVLQQNKTISVEKNTSLEQLKAYSSYYRTRSEEINNSLYNLQKERQELKTEINKIQMQIDNLEGKNRTSRGEISLTLNSEMPQNVNLEIIYLVEDAGWYPNYELRAKNTNTPIHFLYQANMYQNTGEDWKDVEVTLSTADPTLRNQKPNLLPYYLNFNVPRYATSVRTRQTNYTYNPNIRNVSGTVRDESGIPLPGVDIALIGSNIRTQSDFDGNYSLSIPKGVQEIQYNYIGFNPTTLPVYAQRMDVAMQSDNQALDAVVVSAYTKSNERKLETADLSEAVVEEIQKEEQFTVMNFKLPKPYTINSNDEPLKVKLDEQDVEAEYEYYTAPVLDQNVYLTATLTNWESLDLLPGEARIYFEDTYAGAVFLDANINTEDFVVSLGSDQNLVVERKQVNKMKSKSFFRSNSIEEKAYEITLRNNKNQAVEVKLQDRIPISQNDEIKVSEEVYEGASLAKDTGLLSWNVKLDAKSKSAQNFSYRVTYPKGKRVNLER